MTDELLYVLVTCLGLALCVPASILVTDRKHGLSYLVQDPVSGFFVPFVLPLVVTLVVTRFDWDAVNPIAFETASGGEIAVDPLHVALALVSIALFAALDVRARPLIDPIEIARPPLIGGVPAGEWVCVKRKSLIDTYYENSRRSDQSEEERAARQARLGAEREEIARTYRTAVQRWGGLGEFATNASVHAWTYAVFLAVLGPFLAFFFVYFAFLPFDSPTFPSAFTCYFLLLLFFPARLYADWVKSFFSFDYLGDYHRLTVSAVSMGFLALLTLLKALPIPADTLKAGASLLGVIVTAVGAIVAKKNPVVLWTVGRWAQTVRLRYYFLLTGVAFVFLLALATLST